LAEKQFYLLSFFPRQNFSFIIHKCQWTIFWQLFHPIKL